MSISIHAPLTGSDCIHFCPDTTNPQFQSTLPLRGATCINCLCFEVYSISIHAPLTGSDLAVR